MTKSALIAIGGNALVHEGELGTLKLQHDRAAQFGEVVADVVERGISTVITHGNGPQVGYILRRGELANRQSSAEGLPDLPLWLAVADSQGGIGHLLAIALDSVLAARGNRHRAAVVLTHAEVDPADPAFTNPTKPIGPTLSAERAAELAESEGWSVGPTSGDLWRRLVASPLPIDILETDSIAALIADPHTLVIAGGGGGIPVVTSDEGWTPVDAVIDKDRTSALLGAALGIETLVLVTSVDAVMLDFGTPTQRALSDVTADEMAVWLGEGQFPPGSMGPKVAAALDFLERGGQQAVITSMENVAAALTGDAGTRITASKGIES